MEERLTSKEEEVLAAFLNLDKTLTDDYMFNTTARKKVMEELKHSPGSLSNYMGDLLDKKYLTKNPITKKYSLNPFIDIDEREHVYGFKLVKKDEQKA